MNLDCMSERELSTFQTHAVLRAIDADTVTDRQTWVTLASYAGAKRAAMVVRRVGAIATASQLEAECDALYERLPSSVRW